MNRPKHARAVLGVLFTFLALAPLAYGQPQAEAALTAPSAGALRWAVDGERVTAADIEGMPSAQGLQQRGILPGDAVFVHTGWGSLWRDPEEDPSFTRYYSQGPGLSVDAQEYLAARTVVLVALDNPFTDPVPTPLPPDTLPDLPFSVHHNNLTQHGIYQIQNLVPDELARDHVSLSCAMVLPLRILGGAGSMVRPIAVGTPRR